MLRDTINTAMKQAMRNKDSFRLGTIRLILAAIKDQDIIVRQNGNEDGVSETEILAILEKMVKQRHESHRIYQEAGRLELAKQEGDEITIIQEFLPKKLSDDETLSAINNAITKTNAVSIRDMGKVMALLKENYTGKMDFSKVAMLLKQKLG